MATEPTRRASAVVERLRALRAIFTFELWQRLREVETALEVAERSGFAIAERSRLRMVLDSIASSAVAFGLESLYRAARRVSADLAANDGAASDGAERHAFDRLREDLAVLRAAAVQSQQADQPEAPLGVERPRRLLLLFEEAADVASELSFQLGCFGFIVRQANDPEELGRSFRHAAAVLLDVDLGAPGERAWQVLAALESCRRSAQDPPPFIVLSPRDDLAARLAAVRLGADAFLPRPLDVRELIERLDALIGRHAEEPFRVMLVEEDHTTALAVTLALQGNGMEVTRVGDATRAIEELDEIAPDVVLTDLALTTLSGPELAAVVRQHRAHSDLPVVYMSRNPVGLAEQLEAMRRGGDDLVLLQEAGDQLLPTVLHHAQRHRIVHDFRVRDGLTGLHNFSGTLDLLRAESRRAARDGTGLALALIDVDCLEILNEQSGHLAGDAVLRGLARLLFQRFRRRDGLGRSGNRFFVLLPEISQANAARIVDEVRTLFAEIHRHRDPSRFPVTLSCGVACQQPGEAARDLYHEARRAVERARALGSDRVESAGD